MAKHPRLISLALAAVMCTGVLWGCDEDPAPALTAETVAADPVAYIDGGTDVLLEKLGGRFSGVRASFEKIAAGNGTYTAVMDAPSIADVELEVIADHVAGTYSGDLKAGSMGISVNTEFWGTKNDFAVKAPFLLGYDEYGVNFATLGEDLNSSELVEAIFGRSWSELMEEKDPESGMTAKEMLSVFDINKWADAIGGLIENDKELKRDMTPEVKEETLTLGGADVPVISLCYTFEGETLDRYSEEVLLEFMQTLLPATPVEDAETEPYYEKFYLNKATGELAAYESGELPGYGNGEIANFYVHGVEPLNITAELSVLTDEAEGVLDDLGGIADMGVMHSAETSAATDATDGETEESESESLLTVISVNLIEVTDEGKGGLTADVVSKTGDEESAATVSFVRDDADGSYELTVTADGNGVFACEGAITYGDGEFSATVDSASAKGVTAEVGLSFTAKAGGTVEELPEYKNIFTMPLDELEGIFDLIGFGGDAAPDDDDFVEDFREPGVTEAN